MTDAKKPESVLDGLRHALMVQSYLEKLLPMLVADGGELSEPAKTCALAQHGCTRIVADLRAALQHYDDESGVRPEALQ